MGGSVIHFQSSFEGKAWERVAVTAAVGSRGGEVRHGSGGDAGEG